MKPIDIVKKDLKEDGRDRCPHSYLTTYPTKVFFTDSGYYCRLTNEIGNVFSAHPNEACSLEDFKNCPLFPPKKS